MNEAGLPLPSVTLGEVAESIVDGPFGSNLKTSDYVESGVPVLQGKNITGDRFVWKEVRYISDEKARQLMRSSTVVGDHLLIKIGSIGYSAVLDDLDGHDFAIIRANLARIRPDRSVVDDQYLHRVLTSELVVRHFRKVASKTAQPALSLKKIKATEIPLPPLAEQKRIAGILDAADALRAKRRESLAQLDTLLQSTFLDMFGDPVTNPMGWEVRPLGDLGTLDRGVSKHRPRNDPSLLGGGHPLIQTGEVANSEGYIRTHTATYSDLGLRQSRMWPAGTLCITIAANIANTGILTFDACFPDSVVGFSSEEAGRVEYVQGLFWFLRGILERKAPQSAQKNINLKILRGLPVPLPPSELQRRFAAIVISVEKHKASQRAHLNELDTLFASLQSRAFRGDL